MLSEQRALQISNSQGTLLLRVQDLSARLTDQLGDLTKMVGTSLSSDLRRKVNTLIILDVHARDIIDTFVRDTVMDVHDFAWESQLRYYWDRDVDDIITRQCTGKRAHPRSRNLQP